MRRMLPALFKLARIMAEQSVQWWCSGVVVIVLLHAFDKSKLRNHALILSRFNS